MRMFGQKRKTIDALDLSAIADAVARRQGWPRDRAGNAEAEYRKFLYLLMLYPKQTLRPWSNDLDLFWHEHILHTKRYASDCQQLFGRFIDHDPTVSGGEITPKFNTVLAYYRTFGRRAAEEGSSWHLPTAASLAAISSITPLGVRRLFDGSGPSSEGLLGAACGGGGDGGHGGGHGCGAGGDGGGGDGGGCGGGGH
jgi:hypothetical protein